jgi:hypothetical protein
MAHSLHRSQELTIPSVSRIEVRNSCVWVEGSTHNNYQLRLCAWASTESQEEALRLLDGIRLSHNEGVLKLIAPPGHDINRPMADLRVSAPDNKDLVVDGNIAAISVRRLNSHVRLMTTQARIKILETTGEVLATVEKWGVVDFSGSRGIVNLRAPTEINIGITGSDFAGRVEAVTSGAVRVLVPYGFRSAFEAIVPRRQDFICRADLANELSMNREAATNVSAMGRVRQCSDSDHLMVWSSSIISEGDRSLREMCGRIEGSRMVVSSRSS